MDRTYYEYKLECDKLKQLLEKLGDLFYVTNYEYGLSVIEEEVSELENNKKENNDIPYEEFANRVSNLIADINENYGNFYRIHVLTKEINDLLENITSNYDKIAELSESLIIVLSIVDGSKKEDCLKVLNKAYKTLYNVLICERAVNRYLVFDYVKNRADYVISGSLGLIIKDEINKLSEEEKNKLELSTMEYNLESSFILEEVLNALINHSSIEELGELKRITATMELLDKADHINDLKKELDDKVDSRKESMKQRKKIYTTRTICGIIPVLLFGVGLFIGKNVNPRYKITAKTYDNKTKKTISEEYSYEKKSNYIPYELVIKKYDPWEKNPDDVGYMRKVTKWSYVNNNPNEDFDAEQVINDVNNGRSDYTETIDVISETDKYQDPLVYVTEFVLDENYSQSNVAAAIVLSVLFASVGTLPLVIYHDSDKMGEDSKTLKKLKELFKTEINRKIIKRSYEEINGKTVELQEEYSSASYKYGEIVDQLDEENAKKLKKYINWG